MLRSFSYFIYSILKIRLPRDNLANTTFRKYKYYFRASCAFFRRHLEAVNHESFSMTHNIRGALFIVFI
jgi:hypothetical protein